MRSLYFFLKCSKTVRFFQYTAPYISSCLVTFEIGWPHFHSLCVTQYPPASNIILMTFTAFNTDRKLPVSIESGIGVLHRDIITDYHVICPNMVFCFFL